MSRGFWLALLLLGSPSGQAMAAAPPAADVAKLETLFGFDQLILAGVEKGMANPGPRIQALPESDKACLKQVLGSGYRSKLDASFSVWFETGENTRAWIDFAGTPAGANFFEFVRRGMAAIAEGSTPPEWTELMAGLAEDERTKVLEFLKSPPAQILSKGFPKVTSVTSDEELDGFAARVMQQCHLDLGGKS